MNERATIAGDQAEVDAVAAVPDDQVAGLRDLDLAPAIAPAERAVDCGIRQLVAGCAGGRQYQTKAVESGASAAISPWGAEMVPGLLMEPQMRHCSHTLSGLPFLVMLRRRRINRCANALACWILDRPAIVVSLEPAFSAWQLADKDRLLQELVFLRAFLVDYVAQVRATKRKEDPAPLLSACQQAVIELGSFSPFDEFMSQESVEAGMLLRFSHYTNAVNTCGGKELIMALGKVVAVLYHATSVPLSDIPPKMSLLELQIAGHLPRNSEMLGCMLVVSLAAGSWMTKEIPALQQNLWVLSGSGRPPMAW